MTKHRRHYRTMGWHPCPTCGGRYVVAVKKGRSYVLSSGRWDRRPLAPIRVYWPTAQWRNTVRICPDPYHQRRPFHHLGRIEDEREHVAALPLEPTIPLRPEARERAAKTKRRNRLRQGKDRR